MRIVIANVGIIMGQKRRNIHTVCKTGQIALLYPKEGIRKKFIGLHISAFRSFWKMQISIKEKN